MDTVQTHETHMFKMKFIICIKFTEIMKKLAKDKMLRALSNVAYAKGDYEKEMGQAALKKEAYHKKW